MRVFVAVLAAIIFSLATAVMVMAQDPAKGSWVVWAQAQCPAGTQMTHFEATWDVPSSPQPSSAFFSPWIGSDTTDNLDLIQPVNPWLGSGWSAYTEFFEWSPEYNHNSESFPVSSGDKLRGSMTFLGESRQAYKITQTSISGSSAGSSSTQVANVQKDEQGNYKKFTWLYVVFEKYAQCYEYPPDQKVTFEDIKVFCNGKQTYPTWSTHFFQNNCDFRAHVINNETISITWSTSGAPVTPDQIARNDKKSGLKKH